ncbi:MAG TPA: FAD-dependent oxidoreductase [Pyrinomonadaceae bacterium]|nr:FAD-dependent oxidoreductase [Pyrinomonadaceae bacterium]
MTTGALRQIDRRRFLRGALTVSSVAIAMRSTPVSLLAAAAQRRFAPVKVDRNRIIREVVGLRPYRPSGFVVSAERVGRKLIVHNYGHGGAGVTLSWGTASLALDLARDFVIGETASSTGSRRRIAKERSRRFAVLGCGVSGLSTAILLQRRFQDGPGTVTIYAKDLPPETTSNISGAFWYPTSVYDSQQVTAQFTDQYLEACQISHKAFQLLVGADYGVRWIEAFELIQNEASLARELLGGASLYPQIEIHRDPSHYFGFPYTRQFTTLMIEPSIYLSALLRDFYVAGGKLVVKEFRSRDEIARLAEPVMFNCTGLGARELFEDDELIPVRGQLEVLLPQPEIDYCYISGLGYMFPRRDGIILGGTWDHGNWSLNPNPEQTNQILAGHTEVMSRLKK